MINKNQIFKPIKTLKKIHSLAFQRKSIFVKCFNKPLPAAVIMHWQGVLINRFISENQLFEYRRKM